MNHVRPDPLKVLRLKLYQKAAFLINFVDPFGDVRVLKVPREDVVDFDDEAERNKVLNDVLDVA